MSQMALNEFHTHLSKLIDGRSTAEIIKDAHLKLEKLIEPIKPQLIDSGIAKSIQRIRRSRASIAGPSGRDLFEGYDLPVSSSLAKADRGDRAAKKRTEQMTKAEVRNKRDELAQLPRRRQHLLAEYSRLYDEIDKHCADDETVAEGLKRAREEDE